MMSKTVKLSVLAAAVFCVGSAALAQEKKPAAAPAPAAAKPGEEAAKPEENKLVKLTTLEQAFLKANRDRQLLEVLILQETQKLEKAVKEEDKQAIRKTIGEARKRQHLLNTAMDVVFGVGRRRDYEYDTVKSTVYLRVGTVEETFARAVNTREALRKFVGDKTVEKDAEKDAAKKAEIEKQIEQATKQYQLVAASLQVIFNVVPQRNYTYDPKNETLYLKVTEKEVEDLKAKIAELQAKQEAEKAAAAPAPAPAAGKKDEKKK
ncbi:MAG: hypothetical protein BWZ02_02579 [Lentisphaerae bacterium ADurb.BinA184]|nr:MAG: hypothetical protein BWZ02_02579 [Lentisphaerae bacterium ADurb.BinA184]